MAIAARNYTKIRVLLYLRYVAAQATGPIEYEPDGLGGAFAWRAPVTIAFDTGVSAASLYVLLKRWRSNTWGYADGRFFDSLQMGDGRSHWLYRINAKGLSYLNRLHKWYKSLAEVEVSLAEYQKDVGCDFIQWHGLEPRCIAWRIEPSKHTTCIDFPFEHKRDVKGALWAMKGYEVADIKEAVYMARTVFHIMPSDECLTEAKAIQDCWLRDALTKLAAGSGRAATPMIK